MKIFNLVQGSPEWLATRLQHFTASEAPAMMGLSKYQKRGDLLAMKKTGITADIAPATQALFDRGHASEAGARPIAEGIIGEELYPCTGAAEIEGLPLLASFDGLTMAEDVNCEHKLFAGWLATYISEHNDLPDTHWPQAEHQMLVSGAARTLFMVSDGTEENCTWIWYASKPERRAALIAGWKQFAVDLAEFVPQATAPQIVAAPVETLPSVFVQVTGSLAVTDNLLKFEAALQSFVARINKKPENDQDFADCESAIKALSKAEEMLDAAESAALAQVECIDTMRMLKATLKDLARSNRLSLEKLVKSEKENRRMQMVMDATRALASHVFELKCEFFTNQAADFAGVIKGLKSLDSMKDKISTELASAKIKANESVGRINANLNIIATMGEGFDFLFADKATLVMKATDDLSAIIANRIAAHKVETLAKEEELRNKIRAEEDAKASASARIEEERAKQQASSAQPIAPDVAARLLGNPATAPHIQAAVDTSARITLGQINSRLSIVSVTRESLSRLGFEPVGKDRAAILYRASDLRAICNAIAAHVLSVPDYFEQEAA